MRLQKYILCAAVALTAFGLACGLMEIGRYLTQKAEPDVQKKTAVRQMTVEEVTFQQPPVVQKNEPVSSEQVEEVHDSSSELMGDYYIIGKSPKGFKDFDYLSIETKDYSSEAVQNGTYSDPIPPRGYIYTSKKYKFASISISEKRISFETEKINGVSYCFHGERTGKRVDMGEFLEFSIFEGRLRKLRGGKIAADAKVQFAMGGC